MKKLYSLSIITLFLYSCLPDKEKIVVDFNGPSPSTSMISFHQDEAIHVGIASMISPKETFSYYNDLLQYISTKIGLPIHYLQKESYQQVNELLEKGAVDFAFIGSGAYIEAKEKNIARLLVAPVYEEANTYKAYIITNKKSKVGNLRELKGKNFAYTDPFSNAGYYYPIARIKELGYNDHNFFAKTMITYGNDLSCEMVNRGIIDGASINGSVYEYLRKNDPEKVKNIKVIEVSKPFTTPPVVVSKSIDSKKYKLYKNVFLNLHHDAIGREILHRINIDRYIDVNDTDYNIVRKINQKAKE